MARNQTPQLLTVTEVASFLRVSKTTIYRMAYANELPAVRVRCSLRVPLKAVEGLSESDLDSRVIRDESEAIAQ